jgi:hypothetical protein
MGRHQKYIRIFLSFIIAISPVIVMNQANAAIGGWTLSNPVAQGASAVYDATKTVLINGKNVVKTSSIAIAPTAANVAKVLARGGAAAALSVAVEQLLGAVDWVLDPANNAVKYYVDIRPVLAQPYDQYYFSNQTDSKKYYDMNSACQALLAVYTYGTSAKLEGTDGTRCRIYQGTTVKVSTTITKVANPAYDPAAEQDRDEKKLPLETVAAQVISNASSGDTTAQTATMAAAADIVNEAESDPTKAPPISTALDANAVTPTSETATGEATATNPTTGEAEKTELKFEWVKACEWAPSFCEAAQTIISFPQTLTNWWETGTKAVSEAWVAVKEWANTEPNTSDTELDLPDTNETLPNTDISFSTSCPAKIPLQFNWNGQSLDFSFDFTIWCQAISTYVYPIVVTLGSLHALYIVTGVRQDG